MPHNVNHKTWCIFTPYFSCLITWQSSSTRDINLLRVKMTHTLHCIQSIVGPQSIFAQLMNLHFHQIKVEAIVSFCSGFTCWLCHDSGSLGHESLVPSPAQRHQKICAWLCPFSEPSMVDSGSSDCAGPQHQQSKNKGPGICPRKEGKRPETGPQVNLGSKVPRLHCTIDFT